MATNGKQFAEKLRRCLDDMDFPAPHRERVAILSKILSIPKPQAWALLEGTQAPDTGLIKRIAQEFEVRAEWLSN